MKKGNVWARKVGPKRRNLSFNPSISNQPQANAISFFLAPLSQSLSQSSRYHLKGSRNAQTKKQREKKMMPVLSLPLFCSLSQSQSQSQFSSPSPSRRCLYLLCYAIPHSQFQTLPISNKPKPPPSNLLDNTNLDNPLKSLRWKPKHSESLNHYHSSLPSQNPPPPSSTTKLLESTNLDNPLKIPRWKPKQSESLNHYHSSLPSPNPPTSIRTFDKRLGALVRNSDPAAFTLFDRITLTDGIRPDDRTYGLMIKHCARINRLDLAFCFLGTLLKEGHTAKAAIFSPIIKRLCSENRTSEAAAIVLYKMPQLGCMPDVISYSILIKGLCSKGNIGFSLQLFFRRLNMAVSTNPMLSRTARL